MTMPDEILLALKIAFLKNVITTKQLIIIYKDSKLIYG